MFNSEGNHFPPCTTIQQKVLKAASYAALAHEHPVYRLLAKDHLINAYGLAFLDSLGKPQVVSMDISHWTGGIGQWIHMHVIDNVGVVEVRVKIRENIESKKSLESGYAYPSKLNPSIWTYVTKRQFHQVSGFCVDVLSIDLAGNVNWDTVEYTKSE